MSKQHPGNKGAKSKRTYQAPQLTRYGALRVLTQAASGAQPEKGSCTQAKSLPCTPPSDRITKEHIVRIGTHPLGFGLYLFDYKPAFREEWGGGRQFGVMADEVETLMPQAVCVHPDGYKMVNYDLLGITRFTH